MVLDPLERMIEKVKTISQNPMSAASEAINTAGIYSYDKHRELRKSKNLKTDN